MPQRREKKGRRELQHLTLCKQLFRIIKFPLTECRLHRLSVVTLNSAVLWDVEANGIC
jgi:hypothetical protein